MRSWIFGNNVGLSPRPVSTHKFCPCPLVGANTCSVEYVGGKNYTDVSDAVDVDRVFGRLGFSFSHGLFPVHVHHSLRRWIGERTRRHPRRIRQTDGVCFAAVAREG